MTVATYIAGATRRSRRTVLDATCFLRLTLPPTAFAGWLPLYCGVPPPEYHADKDNTVSEDDGPVVEYANTSLEVANQMPSSAFFFFSNMSAIELITDLTLSHKDAKSTAPSWSIDSVP
jgi:hypothetical protein